MLKDMDDRQDFSLDLIRTASRRSAVGLRMKRHMDFEKKGYALERFPEQPRSDFICRVCSAVVRDPKECSECGLLLCGGCWEDPNRSYRGSLSALFTYHDCFCPNCDRYCPPREPSRLLRQLVLGLKVRCKHRSQGCGQVLPLADIKQHQRACEFKRIHCQNYLCCSTVGPRGDFLRVTVPLSDSGRHSINYVCSEPCKHTVLLDGLLRRNEVSAAVAEFHSKAVSKKP